MNYKGISIKKAIGNIKVSEEQLDMIIENAFFETPAPSKKNRWNWVVLNVVNNKLKFIRNTFSK